MLSTRSTGRLALAATLAAATFGCQDIADQLNSDMVAMAVLLKTPDVEVPTVQNGQLGSKTEPGKTELQVYFGRIDKKKITDSVSKQEAQDGAFLPVTGAIVQLDYDGCTACPITLADDGKGKYTAGQDTALAYKEAKYTLTMKYSGSTYKLEVNAPAPLVIDEFRNVPLRTVWGHTPGQAFTMTRYEETAPQKRPVALAAAKAVDGDELSEPWTSPSLDALTLLNLLLDDTDYRAKTTSVDGSVFRADATYLLTLAAVERGAQPDDASLDTLFGASSFIAGVADAGLVSTKAEPQGPMP